MKGRNWIGAGVILACLLVALPAAAADGRALWAKTYGVATADTGDLLKDNGDGTFFITGNTKSTTGTGQDALLMKVDGSGNILWQKTYGSAGDDYAGIGATPDGGFVVEFFHILTATSPLTLMKLDGNGDITWQKTYGTQTETYSMTQFLPGGGFLLSGSTVSYFPTPQGTVRLMKLDASGNIVWQKNYSSPTMLLQGALANMLDGGGYAIDLTGVDLTSQTTKNLLVKLDANGAITGQRSYTVPSGMVYLFSFPVADGGYLLEGSFNPDPEGEGTTDILLAKTNGAGDITWQRTYGGPKDDSAFLLPVSGGFLLSGGTQSFSAGGNQNALLAKLDASGDVLWAKTYGGTQDDHLGAMADSTGGYLLQGETLSYATVRTTNEDFWAVKVNESGDIQWQRAYGGNNDDVGSLHRLSDGGFLMTGDTKSVGAGDYDIWIWKLDSQGQLGFACPLLHDTTTTATPVTLTVGTGTLVAGTSDVVATNTSYTSGSGAYTHYTPSLSPRDACSGTQSLAAGASANPTSGVAPLVVNFTGSATGGTPAYTFSWTFGDGGNSAQQNPSHTYSNPGSYNATLTVTDAVQATATASVTVTVTGSGCTLTCDAAVPSAGVMNLPVSFTSNSTATGCIGTPVFAWTFGDGQTSSSQNPSHTYTTAGTFSWHLTVTVQGQTCTDGGAITISGGGGICTVDCTATVPQAGYKDTDVAFSASASTSGCGAFPVTFWLWTFGDGSQAVEQNPTHAYAATGTYTWTMTATVLPDGVVCYRYGTIKISQEGDCTLVCEASATPSSGAPPLAVQFAASATATNCAGQIHYLWTFGDQSTPSASQNPSHTYTEAGLYTWTMTAQAGDQVCIKYGTVVVSAGGDLCHLACWASANPDTGGSPLTVNFAVTPASSGSCEGPVRHVWTFGDQTPPSTEQYPNHLYSAEGTYVWNVLVNRGSAICTHTGTVTVYDNACGFRCSASAEPSTGPAPLNVVFEGISVADNCAGSPMYLWAFGDGGASTQPNTEHTYASPGTYLWSYTSSIDGLLCSHTGMVIVAAGGTCSLDCTATVPASGTAGAPVAFAATSLPSNCTGAVTYLWNFGDGQTSASQNPSHIYAQEGTYSWTMTASVNGVTCLRSGTIAISGTPCEVTCNTIVGDGDVGVPVQFQVTYNSDSCAGPTTFLWHFGDGASSAEQNPTHTYASPGLFNWDVTVTADGVTCSRDGQTTISGGGNCVSDNSFPDWKAEYWNNTDLAGTPVLVKNEPGMDISHDWVEESPYPGCVNPDEFSVRWTRDLPFTARAATRFRMGSDDGSRLFVDGSPDLFSGTLWGIHGYEVRDIYLPLTTGTHRVVMEFFEGAIYAHALLQMTPEAAPCSFTCAASATPVDTPAPNSAQFSGSVGSYTCVEEPWYHWQFGDGGFSDEINPVHTFPSPGSYTWSLVVTGELVVCYKTGTVTVGGGGGKPGDCNGDGTVSIGEVQKAINMFLGIQAIDCGVDCNSNGTVSIGEVQKVINAFLGISSTC
jgi:PKD repeat protein